MNSTVSVRPSLPSFPRAVLALVLVLASTHVFAESGTKRVLVLHFVRRDAPAFVGVDEAYRKAFEQRLGDTLDYYSEYIDLVRFSDLTYQAAMREYLRARYDGSRLDLVVASSPGVLQFLKDGAPSFVAGVPIVFTSRIGLEGPPNSTGILSVVDFIGSLRTALEVQPDTTRVYVVSGSSDFDRSYTALLRAQTGELEQRVPFTYLAGLPIADLEQRLRKLPAHSVVFYVSVSADPGGHNITPADALDRLSAAASAPIYSWHEGLLGHGIVGGRLHSSIADALATATVALRVLDGEKPETIPVTEIDAHANQFDWRQLQRWNIPETRLPRGSIVKFRDETLWSRYGTYIVVTAAVLLLESATIGGLLIQGVRRRRAEAALAANELALRRASDQTRSLAGRLLTAQENERARIARELHDDVSEGLAALSLEVHGLRKTNGVREDEHLQLTLTALQQGISGVADSIRSLSHELHPEIIQHVGLVSALASLCREVQSRQGLTVAFIPERDCGPFSPEVALCLFRIAQEALRNTCKHAGARRAHVTLGRHGASVELCVEDDGAGFDLARARQNGGLGLVSVDERVRLRGGTATIDTAPGAGTKVRVIVPLLQQLPA